MENDSQYSLTENEVDTVTNNSNMDYYTKAMNAIETNKDLFLRFKIKSYAVRVEGDDDTEVSIAAGKITNSVGGGVYVGGGHVTLGAKDNENESDPTISTEGNTYISRKYYYSGSISQDGWWPNRYDVYTTTSAGFIPISSGDVTTWRYGEPLTGGHAVAVEGGSLTVYGGSYTADLGNGILVNNTDSAKKVNIEGGNFIGYNGSFSYGDITGPAGYYGLKVVGGSVEITDGTFGSNTGTSNGSAFFMGTYSQETGASRSTVQINGGTYYSYDTDAITTFRYTDITISGEINVGVTGGERAALAMQDDLLYNNDTNYPDRYATIKVDQGTFTGTSFGIYYGAGFDQLSINGGTFNGGGGTGLHFAVVPNNQNVQIVKGTFKGSSAVSGNSAGSISTGNIIASGSWCFDGEGYANENALCTWTGGDYEYNGRWYHYYQVGGDNSVALNNGNVYTVRNDRVAAINAREKIEVKQGDQKVFDYFDPY